MPPKRTKKEPIPPQQMPQEVLEELRISRDAADMALAAYGEMVRKNEAMVSLLYTAVAGHPLACNDDPTACYYFKQCKNQPGNEQAVVKLGFPHLAHVCVGNLQEMAYDKLYTPVPEDEPVNDEAIESDEVEVPDAV